MGNGIISQLETDETKYLRTEYERLQQEGYADEEIQSILTKLHEERKFKNAEETREETRNADTVKDLSMNLKYTNGTTGDGDRMVQYFAKEDHTIIKKDVKEETGRPPRRGVSKDTAIILGKDGKPLPHFMLPTALDNFKVNFSGHKSQPKRRISLNNKIISRDKLQQVKTIPQEAVDAIAETSTQDQPSVVQEDVDHVWESAIHQPVCTICHMYFKTEAQREKHVSYSTIHAKMVIQHIAALEAQQLASQMTLVEDSSTIIDAVALEEEGHGTKAALTYSGTKFFWNPHDEIDIEMYLHPGEIFEVITNNAGIDSEINREYLSMAIILENIGPKELEKKINDIDEDRPPEHVFPSSEAKYEDGRRHACTAYILSRLVIIVDKDGRKKALCLPSTIDNGLPSPVLVSPPEDLIPATFTIKRRTLQKEDIDKVFNSILKAQTNVKLDMAEAQKKLDKVDAAIEVVETVKRLSLK